MQKNQSLAALFLLFRKKARSAHLFICKRTHDGAQSLPPFYEHPPAKLHLNHLNLPEKRKVTLVPIFLCKKISHLLHCSSFFVKRPARRTCLFASARTTVRSRYYLFTSTPGEVTSKPFESSRKTTSYACSDFFMQKNQSLAALFLLFRKKARSAHLFICKRTHDGAQSLPPFYEHPRQSYI